MLVKEKIYIDIEINKISDILQLCKDYPLKFGVEYNIDMEAIHRIESPLKQLNNMRSAEGKQIYRDLIHRIKVIKKE